MVNGTSATVYQLIDFRNTGQKPCTLSGFPAVWFGTGKAAANRIGLPAAHVRALVLPLVTLRPGAAASAELQISDASDYPRSACDPVQAPYLVVTSPAQSARTVLSFGTAACRHLVRQLTIAPIHPTTNL
jgi:Protein of unknown function (DUF4232)